MLILVSTMRFAKACGIDTKTKMIMVCAKLALKLKNQRNKKNKEYRKTLIIKSYSTVMELVNKKI